MDLGLVVSFWGVSVLFVLTPGADWAYAIASGIRYRDGVFPAVSGMLAGHLAATLIVAAGVATVLAASPIAMFALTTAGATYLIWLGASTLQHPATAELADQATSPRGQMIFWKGLGISLLNPKVFLLFLALLPQFASTRAPWPIGGQMIALGALHVANCAIVYFAIGYGAASFLTKHPKATRIVSLISGAVMIALGAFLMIEKAIDALS